MRKILTLILSICIWNVQAIDTTKLHFSIENHGHAAPVRKILVDQNRKEIISVAEDKSVCFWDLNTFELKETIHINHESGNQGSFLDACFSPDSNFIFLVGSLANPSDSTNYIKILNLNSKQISRKIQCRLPQIQKCIVSNNQTEFLVSYRNKVEIYSILDKSNLSSKGILAFPFELTAMITTAKNELFVSSSTESSVFKISHHGNEITKTARLGHHFKPVRNLVYANGKIISAGDDYLVNLYDSTGNFLHKIASVKEPISSISVSNDGKHIFIGEENTGKVYFINTEENKIISQATIFNNTVFSSHFIENKNGFFALCSGGTSHEIEVLNPSSAKLVKRFSGESLLISELSFHDQKLYFNDQSQHHTLHEYLDFNTFKININHTNYSAPKSSFQILNPYTVKISTLKIKTTSKQGRILSFWKNENNIFIGTDYLLLVYTLNGKLTQTLTAHIRGIRALTTGKIGDQEYLFSSGEDGFLKLWKLTADGVATHETFDLYINSNRQWVLWSNLGYFVSSDKGADLAGFQQIEYSGDSKFTTLDHFFDVLFKPLELAESIKSGKPIEQILADKNERIVDLSDIKGASYVQIDDFYTSKTNENKETILYPKPLETGYTTSENEIDLLISAVDGGAGIKEINVLCNGKLIVLDNTLPTTKTLDRIKRTYKINLIPGVNHLEVFALNYQKRTSMKLNLSITSTANAKASTDLYALLIGINRYKNPKNNLNFAYDDAQSLGTKLTEVSKGIFNKTHLKILLDEEANKKNIIASLEEFSSKANPNDVFVFYFAGHGVINSQEENSEYFLIPQDVVQLHDKDENLQKVAISASDIKTYLTKIKAQKQLILLDACHSGGAVKTLSTRGAPEEKAIFQLARSSGIVLISASETDQFATEFKALGHGVFTYTLLEALSGKADGGEGDKKLTVNELKIYMEDHVPLNSQKHGGKTQYPTGFSTGQDFPIGIVKQ